MTNEKSITWHAPWAAPFQRQAILSLQEHFYSAADYSGYDEGHENSRFDHGRIYYFAKEDEFNDFYSYDAEDSDHAMERCFQSANDHRDVFVREIEGLGMCIFVAEEVLIKEGILPIAGGVVKDDVPLITIKQAAPRSALD